MQDPPTARSSPPPEAAPGISPAWARIQAATLLAAGGLLGWAVLQLGRFDRPPAAVHFARDARGDTVALLIAPDRPGGGAPEIRCVMARAPLARIDPDRSLLVFASGRERVLPAGAEIVLIGRGPRIEPLFLGAPLPRPFLEFLLAAPPGGDATWADWFAARGVSRYLGDQAGRVAAFWGE